MQHDLKRERTAQVVTLGTALRKKTSAPILPAMTTCSNCGQHMRAMPWDDLCRTCIAWRKWFFASRLASRFLREARR